MREKLQDLKPRTKAFALRVICMYSKLPKNDTVAQVLGKPRKKALPHVTSRFFVPEHRLVQTTAKHRAPDPRPSSSPRLATVSRKSRKPSIGSNSSWTAAAFPQPRWPICSTKPANSSPYSRQLTNAQKGNFSL